MGNSQQDLSFNKNEDQMKLKISKLNKRLNEIKKGGGDKKIEKHHSKGKLTARERLVNPVGFIVTDYRVDNDES